MRAGVAVVLENRDGRAVEVSLDAARSANLVGAGGSLRATAAAAPGTRAHVLAAAPADPAVAWTWAADYRCVWSK